VELQLERFDARLPTHAERNAARRRPAGTPILQLRWRKILFLHWRVPVAWLRPLVPEPLAIDQFDGSAWVGIVPFTMTGVRPTFAPPLPGLSSMLEVNVRTYVHYDGVPGVYFMSMDTDHALATWIGRRRFHLPYHRARVVRLEHNRRVGYASQRSIRGGELATFSTTYTVGPALPPSQVDSPEFFFTERYCLYTIRDNAVNRLRIHHAPWPLRSASVHTLASSLFSPLGLPEPKDQPHALCADELSVEGWPMKKA
jgi:uncharacterized protein